MIADRPHTLAAAVVCVMPDRTKGMSLLSTCSSERVSSGMATAFPTTAHLPLLPACLPA
jgi:hypothetical protein